MYDDPNDLFDLTPDTDPEDYGIYDDLLPEDEFEDDEFDFPISFSISKKARAAVIWADPLPAPAGAAVAKPGARSEKKGKADFSAVAFVAALFSFGLLAFYLLLTFLSACFMEDAGSVDIVLPKLIFSFVLTAILTCWLCIPTSKRKNEWAFKAVNIAALSLASVALICFIVFCRLL